MLKILKNKNSVFFVMILLFITKVLGFLKLRTIALLFGISHELDIFWAAFTIPDILFMVLVAGSLNAAVIPVFSDIFHKEGEKDLNKFFNYLTIMLGGLSTAIALILFIFTPQLTSLLIESDSLQNVLNFSERITPEDYILFVKLTRIMMISPVLLGISSLMTGYLQVRKQFFVTSLAPLFYNLAMILGSVVLVVSLDMGVEGIAISAVIGSAIHFLIQIPSFRSYYDRKFKLGFRTIKKAVEHKKTRLALKLAIPRTIGILGEQINVIVNTLISFSLASGALSAYKFALSLHLFPINIIGSAVAQVALPNLAEHSENEKKFSRLLNNSIQFSLFLVLPVVATLIVLRLPIVRLAYGAGAFHWRATILTAWCLVLLGFSIIGQTVVQILLRAFYAIKETWLPLIAISVGVVVNIVLAYYLTNFFSHYYDWRPILEQMFLQVAHADGEGFITVFVSFVKDFFVWSSSRGGSDMAVGGLSLSLSLSYLIEMVLLVFLLNTKQKVFTLQGTLIPTFKKFLNTVLTFIGMYLVFKLFDFQLDTTRTVSVVVLTACTTVYGFVSYWLGAKVLKIREVKKLDDFWDAMVGKFKKSEHSNEVV